jgi:hypothetical protein
VRAFATDPLPAHSVRRRKNSDLLVIAMLEHIQTMRALLEQQGKCRCAALEECGKKMLEKQCANALGNRRMSALKVRR